MIRTTVLLLLVTFTISCSKEDNNNANEVTVRLTDDPSPAEEVNVDIRSVALKYDDDDANDHDGKWVILNTHDTIYNLLDLQNDVSVVLASGPYPHQRIHEIRLILGDNNSIKIGGIVYPLTVPSGSSSGFKIKVDKDLSPGPNDILIDFDAGLSVHETGNGKFMLQPVLRIK